MALAIKKLPVAPPKGAPDSRKIVAEEVSNELVFAIVGHVGSGNTTVATTLQEVFQQQRVNTTPFKVAIIKARTVIDEGMARLGAPMPVMTGKLLSDVQKYQNAGDKLRKQDHAAVARGAVSLIRKERAAMQGTVVERDKPVLPDGKPRAFIVDSIRHPAEVGLLRRIYGDAFVLIGVVCEQDERRRRISKKYSDAGESAAEAFMKRDAKASEKNGQRVSDAFHLSDFFVDNTAQRILDDNRTPNPDWKVTEDLERLIQLVTHAAVARPTTAESAMHAAAGAAMRSACMSRQVGAALVDADGNLIATGTNEAPKAGGGVYAQGFDDVEPSHDHRCAFGNKYCSNTREQNKIAEEILVDLFGENDSRFTDKEQRDTLVGKLRNGRIGDLLEFSRAVHAEMDALLSAGRKGATTTGSRLFVTTFPCHYCARHIVSAGVDEVQFIEPYPKSQALLLHRDSIQFEKGLKPWLRPSDHLIRGERKSASERDEPRVLFRPFTGVAPRMYGRAFQKDRELKDKLTGDLLVQEPEWGTPYDLSRKSYAELETALTKDAPE
jgi:deoxycytidylate deaminase